MDFVKVPYDEDRTEAYYVWLGRASDLHQDFRPSKNEIVAWSPVELPLKASRVALLTTAGVHCKGDAPFDELSEHGDPTFRTIPAGTEGSQLAISHAHYGHTDADTDPNCVFPIDRLRDLVEMGKIGSEAAEHFGFMGFNPNPAQLISEATTVARRLRDDDVNMALLSPG